VKGTIIHFARPSRLLAFVFLLMLGLGTLSVSPVAAANCANIGAGSNLAGCDLAGMDLSDVNLAGANLRRANLTGTNLDGANLSGANLSNARITEGALDSANTSGANLRGIRYVSGPQIIFIENTVVGTNHLYTFQFTGFSPNASLTYEIRFSGGFVSGGNVVQTDGAGSYVSPPLSTACGGALGTEFTVSGTDGLHSASVTMPIPR
jgi:hypothetical protein